MKISINKTKILVLGTKELHIVYMEVNILMETGNLYFGSVIAKNRIVERIRGRVTKTTVCSDHKDKFSM